MRARTARILIGIFALLIILSLTFYTVDERENVIVFQLGEIVDVKKDPGLYAKIPLLQNVRYFDTRILTLDSPQPERFITAEKNNVIVDSFVKWRIVDVRRYYVSVGGDEARANTRLSQSINDGLRAEFGKRTLQDVVSGQRDKIMDILRNKSDADARQIGIQVIDVRLKRVDLPQEVSESVYQRMEAERKRVANELRSLGAAESEKIRADADRQREVTIAEAYRDAQRIKGEGDAQAAAIYAGAYGQQPEFYAFYRSLDAYRQSFRDKNNVMVLDPNSDFFRYFKAPGKTGK